MRIQWSLALFVLVGAAGYGQALDLKNLNRLADKATEKVEVTLDGSLLKLAAGFLSANDPDEAKVKKVVAGLKGIYVKSFEFEKEGEYSEADVASLRKQLQSSGWSRIVGVVSKKDGENAEIYLNLGSENGGLAIICAAAKELTVVNIVGKINLEELSQLGGKLGVPEIEVEKQKPPKKDDD